MTVLHLDDPAGATPLTVTSLVTESSIDPLAAALIVGSATLYAVGVSRLERRGRPWRTARSIAFASGLIALALATQSGLAAYESSLFSAHVAQHVLIGMVAPFFLALGAPVTLALQASPRPVQVRLLAVLHSRPVRVATHPIVAFALFGVSLFVVYFTALYELSLRNTAVHLLVHLHFLVAGSVFFWVVVGLDPVGRRIPHGWRMLLVALTVPFHAFLGLAMYSASEPFGAAWYRQVARPAVSLAGDQHTGAGLMWVTGELVGLVAGGVVLAQWMAHDARSARRADAVADRRVEVGA